jgi:glycerol-3-phosphate dehydrogenase
MMTRYQGMKRNLVRLARNEYDVLVVGGGIYGACVAWDATLRGLSVALVDRGDFGHATSANSLKIVHGGLRYLQDARLNLVRTMTQERATWMRIAPHLVHPLPCLMPTSKKLTRNKAALKAALRVNDLVGHDRNRRMDPQKYLPNGRIISKDECLQLLPGIPADGITGGAVWYDAQIHNSERLLLSFILSAAGAGAEVANYVEVIGFLGGEKNVTGVKAKDVLTGQAFDIRARIVVNSAGAWVDSVLGSLNGRSPAPKFHPSTAMNLVTRQILPEYAVGVSSNSNGKHQAGNPDGRSQILFIVPWHEYSLIGTKHAGHYGPPQNGQVTEQAIRNFLDDINSAYPEAALAREDVYHVHWGFLPAVENKGQSNGVKLVRGGQVYDHQQEDGIAGLITMVGVKYTTARYVARQAIDLVVKKLNRKLVCQTHQIPVYGGQIDRFDDFLAQAIVRRSRGLGPEIIKHLVYTYGSEYCQILKYLDEKPIWGQTITAASPVIKAEVIHAAREEMGQKLTDIIRRRTELGAAGLPDETCLRVCADLAAAELGWDQVRREREIGEVRAAYARISSLTREKAGAN